MFCFISLGAGYSHRAVPLHPCISGSTSVNSAQTVLLPSLSSLHHVPVHHIDARPTQAVWLRAGAPPLSLTFVTRGPGNPRGSPWCLLASGTALGPHPCLQILTLSPPHRSVLFIVKLHNNHRLSSSPSSGLLDIARFWSYLHKPASYQSRFTLET